MIALASLADTAQGIVDTFGIDWPMLIAQAINFLIVALVIWKFAFKNILSTIKEREQQISDSLKNADRIKLELEETEKQQQETLQEASLAAKKNHFLGSRTGQSLNRGPKGRCSKASGGNHLKS